MVEVLCRTSDLLSDSTTGRLITPKKIDNLLPNVWKRRVNLQESHKPATANGEHLTVHTGDVVVITKTGNNHKQPQTITNHQQTTTNHHLTTTNHQQTTTNHQQATTNG